MRWQIIFATVSLAACLGASAPQAGKSDQDAIQGVWNCVSSEFKGQTVVHSEPHPQWVIKGNTIHMKGKDLDMAWTFTLDPSKNPKEIDMTPPLKGKTDSLTNMGIYELNGDDLRIHTNDPKVRPMDFKTNVDSSVLWVLKRIPKNDQRQ